MYEEVLVRPNRVRGRSFPRAIRSTDAENFGAYWNSRL